MEGKVCLVTGGTSGIGRAAAVELARRGAIVVIVGRDPDRCAAAALAMQDEARHGHVEPIAADMSSQREVRRLAREFQQRHDRLDVLINNVGAFYALRRESADGFEMTFALDHLASFLLTNLLLDVLRSSAPARIVNVSSDAHRDVKKFEIDDPELRSRTSGWRAYPRSEWSSLAYALATPWGHPAFQQYAHMKLANLLFTYELAARLDGTGVTVNAVHPGVVSTEFASGNGVYGWFMKRWMQVFALKAEEGAKPLVHLATAPELESTTGQYFVKNEPAQPSPAALDRDVGRRLWNLSERMTAAQR
jgi:NAD(P)-dependent dehydrogenase (short-subunit alcohol dehydrogenase family)